MFVYNKIAIKGGIMKKKILSFLIAICLIVPAICMLSACGEKKYDIEITTNTQIEHIQEIKFSSSSTKKTTYRNSEPTYIEVICDQGYAPDLVFSVGDMQISDYSDYFVDLYYQIENPDYDPNYQPETADDPDYDKKTRPILTIYTGVLYSYTIPTKDLTGKKTVTYSGVTKTAKVRLEFVLSKEYEEEDPFDGDYEGLSFEFTGLPNNQKLTYSALDFISFANENKCMMIGYDEVFTITLKSTRNMNNGAASNIFNIWDHWAGVDAPGPEGEQLYYSWKVKSQTNFSLLLNLRWLKAVFPQEEV